MTPDPLSLSKHQQRKHAKRQWLTARKPIETTCNAKKSRSQRRKQRQRCTSATNLQTPTVSYSKCTLIPCMNHRSDSYCVLRRIAPYVHRFALFIKGRWHHWTVRDLFAREFSTLSMRYCARAIQAGLVRVNGRCVTLDTVLQQGDYFEHFKHRHEPILHLLMPHCGDDKKEDVTRLFSTWSHFETDDLLVVNKPSGVPVHPSGKYHFNSLTGILQHDYRRSDVVDNVVKTVEFFPVHRLDRLTSGLLLLAKTADKARCLSAELAAPSSGHSGASRYIQKLYVARVQGRFPDDRAGFAHVQGLSSGRVTIESVEDNFWRVTASIGLKIPRHGHVQCVTESATSKSCVTLVRRRGEALDGESIVECMLVTGRTHQIRVHLQHLGFPIVNDPLYGEVETRDVPSVSSIVPTSVDTSQMSVMENNPQAATTDKEDIAKRCIDVCDMCAAEFEEPEDEEVETQRTGLWLHSYCIRSPHWSFEVPLPHWACLHETAPESSVASVYLE